MVRGGGETGNGLARVTYLPGATALPPPPPPPTPTSLHDDSAQLSSAESAEDEARQSVYDAAIAEVVLASGGLLDAKELPTFASFYGAPSEINDAERTGWSDDEQQPEPEQEPQSEPESGSGAELAPERSGSRHVPVNRREVRAENVSMHALTRRGMSRWELEKTLLSRELDSEVVTAELARLEAVGLIDDAMLAENFVRTQHERKGLGRGALTAELRRRHVDQQHIDAALEQVDDDDEQTRATELAVKRAGQLSSYDLETTKRRLHGFLSRKGYSSSVVRAAIDDALSPRSGGVRFR